MQDQIVEVPVQKQVHIPMVQTVQRPQSSQSSMVEGLGFWGLLGIHRLWPHTPEAPQSLGPSLGPCGQDQQVSS